METANMARLRNLHSLYNKVSETLLGHPPEDRTELNRLKKVIIEEIKDIQKSHDFRLRTPA